MVTPDSSMSRDEWCRINRFAGRAPLISERPVVYRIQDVTKIVSGWDRYVGILTLFGLGAFTIVLASSAPEAGNSGWFGVSRLLARMLGVGAIAFGVYVASRKANISWRQGDVNIEVTFRSLGYLLDSTIPNL